MEKNTQAIRKIDFNRGLMKEGVNHMIEKDTQVIRKSDFKEALPIIGKVVDGTDPKRVVVEWQSTKNGMGGKHSSTVLASALLVLDRDTLRDLYIRADERRRRSKVEWIMERPYVCVNVNKYVRVSNDGHKAPELLLPSQVKDMQCIYCGHTVVMRCACCKNPAKGDLPYCQECCERFKNERFPIGTKVELIDPTDNVTYEIIGVGTSGYTLKSPYGKIIGTSYEDDEEVVRPVKSKE